MSAITATTASTAAAQAAASATKQSTSTNNLTSLASEDTFLKLFVAQLQNQDPLNPNEQSGTQMVSQLAQFSQLEQTLNIGTDVHTIVQDIGKAGTSSSAVTTPAVSGTTQPGSTTQS